MKINEKLPDDLAKELGRDMIDPHVVGYVNAMLDMGKPHSHIDDYLLNCPLVTQEEREFITEEIYDKVTAPILKDRKDYLYKVMKELSSIPLKNVLSIIKQIENSLESFCMQDDNDAFIICNRDELYDTIQDIVFMHAPEGKDAEEEAIDIDIANEWTSELYEYFLKNYKFVFEDEEEQQRRDEKNGLYPDRNDIAN